MTIFLIFLWRLTKNFADESFEKLTKCIHLSITLFEILNEKKMHKNVDDIKKQSGYWSALMADYHNDKKVVVSRKIWFNQRHKIRWPIITPIKHHQKPNKKKKVEHIMWHIEPPPATSPSPLFKTSRISFFFLMWHFEQLFKISEITTFFSITYVTAYNI